METIKLQSTVGIGINLRLGTWQKRMWFEVPDSEESKALFFSTARKINDIESNIEWIDFLLRVQTMLQEKGFDRIAK